MMRTITIPQAVIERAARGPVVGTCLEFAVDASLSVRVPFASTVKRCPDGWHEADRDGYGRKRCVQCGHEWEFTPA